MHVLNSGCLSPPALQHARSSSTFQLATVEQLTYYRSGAESIPAGRRHLLFPINNCSSLSQLNRVSLAERNLQFARIYTSIHRYSVPFSIIDGRSENKQLIGVDRVDWVKTQGQGSQRDPNTILKS